jgi:hypothetical protein
MIAVRLRKFILAGFAALGLLLLIAPGFAQPAPVPALPDTERRTSYSISASTCSCLVNFALFGDSTDFNNWVEVFLNGVRVNFNDPTFGWAITSPSGSLATIPRPVTNAVLTFTGAQTGTVQIVGARRPRLTSQFNEGAGVPTRNFNVVLTDLTAQNRELWDKKTNDVTGQALLSQPGNTMGPLPLPALCANALLGFDGTGLNPVSASANGAVLPVVSGNIPNFTGTTGLLHDSGKATPAGAIVGTTDSQTLTNKTFVCANQTSCVVLLGSDVTGQLPIGNGGTGQTTAAAAISALMPTPTHAGDIVYWNGSNWVTLAGNNSGTLTLQENASGVPVWASVAGTGTVTSVTCGAGLSGGTITTSG